MLGGAPDTAKVVSSSTGRIGGGSTKQRKLIDFGVSFFFRFRLFYKSVDEVVNNRLL